MRGLVPPLKRWMPIRWLLAGGAAVCAVSLAAAPPLGTAPSTPRNDVAIDVSAKGPGRFPPAELRIGNIDFQVKIQPFADTYAGMTHFDTHTVQIDPGAAAALRRQVYLHEVLHVAWHNGSPSNDKSRKYTEEEAIQALTPGLLKIMSENPQAVAYLQK